ncbi:2-oxo-tetronate isomerase [Solimicrobium silvestre]|uniref:Hydroxypyruvate isomerase n=1 Tax=Solimicrobium silvestre TaxID=2099400 RepID=A0A2S9GV19_9BURK|nr:2-oxo-tetronate isomerase [Solimicrobium silvestre]PRC91551.1 Hydroxypyruvate isomerase [Solimicrobium silvestre]
MPRFAANLSMMYPEFTFVERFAAAAHDGFKAVEFQFPYEFPAAQINTLLADNNLTLALFNAPPGNWANGERGLASLPNRINDFKHSIDQALNYAHILGNKKLHVMAGLIQPDSDSGAQRNVYLNNLAYAAELAQQAGINLVIEPINTRDMPSYFLNQQEQAQAICTELALPNVQVLFDIYHCQIMEGDLATKLRRDMQRNNAGIGHIQIAGAPDRHEPDLGEINYPYLFELIDALGYTGWIGCEYRPRNNTSAGLTWLKSWL